MRLSPRIKICGLTRLEDARAALDFGAHMLGFVLHPKSPRGLSVSAFQALRRQLPATACLGAVITTSDQDLLESIAGAGFSFLQVHGAGDFPWQREFSRPLVRAFDPSRDSLSSARDFLAGPGIRGILLDPRDPDRQGGTGRTHPLELAQAWLREFPNAGLAGGLRPENLEGILARLTPEWIDVSSGIEAEPGRKDLLRMRAFFEQARVGPGSERA